MAWQNWFKNANSPQASGPGRRAAERKAAGRSSAPSAWLLEPRMLFDGAVAATVTTAVINSDAAAAESHAGTAQSSAAANGHQAGSNSDHADAQQHNADGQINSPQDNAAQRDQAGSATEAVAIGATRTPTSRHEVAFVDASLDNYQSLINGINPEVEVVPIDGNSNGLQQIADWATRHSGYDAIHLFTHGSDGQINLGNWVLTDGAMKTADVQAALATLGGALTTDGDLLLYGCDVGAGDRGTTFINDLAAATGADVAASADATGSSLLGGNWLLEKQSGDIETASLHVESYEALLVKATFTEEDAASGDGMSFTKNVGGFTFTFSAPTYLGIDYGVIDGLYTLDGESASGNGMSLTITAPAGYSFDLAGFTVVSTTGTTHYDLTRADGSVTGFNGSTPGGQAFTYNGVSSAFNDITKLVITGAEYGLIQDLQIIDIRPVVAAPVNAAPVTGNLNGDLTRYTEGDAPVLLDSGSDATVTDSDSANFDGGSLTVSITANGVSSEDVLGYRTQGTGTGQIGATGDVVTYGGQAIGVLSGGAQGHNLVITFNSNATPEAVQALVRALTYYNSNDSDPSVATRTLSITVSDGDGATSSTAALQVEVAGVNQAPVFEGDGSWQPYTESGSQLPLFFNVSLSPVEADQTITGLVLRAWNSPQEDSGDVLTIDGSAIALRPGSGVTALHGFSWTVAEVSGMYTLTLTKAEGVSGAVAGALVSAITYSNSSNSSFYALRQFELSEVRDSGGTGNGGADTAFVGMQSMVELMIPPAANSAPLLGGLDGGTVSYTEGGTPVLLDSGSNATVTDSDSASFDGGSLTVAITANGNGSEDVLAVQNSGTAAGQIGVDGSTVTWGGTAIGTLSGGTGGAALVVALNSSATPDAVQALVRAVTYHNSNQSDPSTATRSVSVTVSDGDGGTSQAAGLQIAVTGVNDAPVVTATSGTYSYNQADSALTLFTNASVDTVEAGQTITEVIIRVWSYTTLPNASEVLHLDGSDVALVSGRGVTADNGMKWTVSQSGTMTYIRLYKTDGIDAAAATALVAGMAYRNSNAESAGMREVNLAALYDNGGTAGGGADVWSAGKTSWLLLSVTPPVPAQVSGIDAPQNGAYKAGDTLQIFVHYDSDISLDTLNGSPLLQLNLGSGPGFATLSGLAGGNTLVFDYTVQAGDSTADLDVSGSAALTLNGAILKGSNGLTADTALPEPGAANSLSANNDIVVDTTPPTATITLDRAVVKAGDVAEVTVTFSEAISNFSEAALEARYGTLSDFTSSDGGKTWTGWYSPMDGYTDSAVAIGMINAMIYDAAGNQSSGTTRSENFTLDTDPPSAVVTLEQNQLSAGETTQIAVTFSEAVTGFSRDNVRIYNGEVSEFSSQDGGKTWTATLTPLADSLGTGDISIDTRGVQDRAGNDALPVDRAPAFFFDTELPTATLSLSNSALKAGDTAVLTVTFSEYVSGLTLASFKTPNGFLSDLKTEDGGLTWTAVYTPESGIGDETNTIVMNNAGATDFAGNKGTGITRSENFTIDTRVPDATILVEQNALIAGGSSRVTITFTSAVSELPLDAFSAEHGQLSALRSTDGITWYADYTPDAGVTELTNVITLDNTRVQDRYGNSGQGVTTSNNYAIDTLPPKATIVVAEPQLAIGETSRVTITFNESVTGLTLDAFSVPHGVLSELKSTDGGVTWTAVYTPSTDVTATASVITLNNGAVRDGAGNAGEGITASAEFAVDTKLPTAVIKMSDVALKAGETATVTVTFSEPVSGLTTAAFSVPHGVLSGLKSTDGGTTWTAVYTPSADVTATVSVITLNNAAVRDAAGNAGAGMTASAEFAVDTQLPTAEIRMSDAALKAGETAEVTVTFSEPVSGLTTAAFSVPHGVLSDLKSTDGGTTWTAVYTPSANVTESANVITLNNAAVQDAAGNAGAGIATSADFAVDTRLPTATIALSDAALKAGESATVTVTFSEPVSGLTTAAFSVPHGELSGLKSTDGGTTWTAVYTPSTDVTTTSNVITLNNAAVRDGAGNAGAGITASAEFAVDTQLPTAEIRMSDAALKAGETAEVTITFSEPVFGLTTAAFSVPHGVLSGLKSTDGGTTWTAVYTPSANVTESANAITLNNAAVQDAAGNAGAGIATSADFAVDTRLPTATIALSDAALKAGESATVTVTFSEPVSGLTTAAFSVPHGELSNLKSTDGGTTWTAVYTPSANVTESANVITLNNAAVQDSAGNTGAGMTTSAEFAVDTQLPTAEIRMSDAALKAGETALVTVTFSEPVSGLTIAAFSVPHGVLSGLKSTDGGVTWTAVYTPSADVTESANVIILNNAAVRDGAGNAGEGITASADFAVDTQLPTAVIEMSDAALKAGETVLVTVTFSEPVSGLTTAAFSVPHGVLSDLKSTDGGMTWTAVYTPAANITATASVITLNNAAVRDAAGNAGAGTTTSADFAVDTQLPTAVIEMNDAALKAGETAEVTITFSEPVAGLTTSVFSVPHGVLSGLESIDGGVTWTAVYTPGADVTATASVITLNNAAVRDAAGNPGAGTTTSADFPVDTRLPTAVIKMSDAALKAGETATVTVTFSEPVSGLTTAAFSVPHGVLSDLKSTDGGTTWTAVYTPSANVTESANVITLNNAAVQDAAGNAGAGTTMSADFAVDTRLPTAEIRMSDAALKAGETALVTVTFSEPVSGLTTAAFSVPHGELSGLKSTDGGTTWTAVYTPSTDVTTTSNVITLNNAAVRDGAGNAGAGITASAEFAVDTQLPTAEIRMSDAALKAGETAEVTITFSEPVFGLTTAAFSVPHGVLSGLKSTDGGVTWTAVYTPSADVTTTSNVITLNNAAVRDAAGNAGEGITASAEFAVDTQLPTAEIRMSDAALKARETAEVTVTFSEPVSGLTTAAFSVPHGELSGLKSTDGGVTWTAVYTPLADVTTTSNVITLNNAAVRDAAGNQGAGTTTSADFAVDTRLPTAVIKMSDAALKAGETAEVTVTFSEPVSGLTTAAFSVPHGELSGLKSTDGGLTWTAVYTPSADVTTTSNVITLNNAAVRDAAGNAGEGITASADFAVDTRLPTATIALSDAALKAGETAIVTVTFSEPVSGLTTAAFSVPHGELSGLKSTDGGVTWTAVYTPLADVTTTSNVITLNNAAVRDAAGNQGAGTTTSADFAVDTRLPTATIALSDAALKAGETAEVTVTFSEPVSGLTTAAFSVPHGVLSGLKSTDGGVTWTAVYTPSADVTATANSITLNNAAVGDAAGNAGAGITTSARFDVDTLHPQAVSLTLDAGNAPQTLSYSFSMSEPVRGLSTADFSLVTSGTLGASIDSLTQTSATTWQIQLSGVTGSGTVQLVYSASRGSVTDAAGNPVSADISSAAFSNSTPRTSGLADVVITQQQPFTLKLPADSFSDVDSGDSLTYRATLADGSALPGWLAFDAATLTMSGTPSRVGEIQVLITAADNYGQAVASRFTLRTTDLLNGDPQFRTDRHSSDTAGLASSYSREQLSLLALAGSDSSTSPDGDLFITQDSTAGSLPSAAAAFGAAQQGGNGGEASALATVFSHNGVNTYHSAGRSGSSDVSGDMSGRSSLAAQFALPAIPGTTGLEVFSGSSWQQVDNNSITQIVPPTSVFGTPVFSQQLQLPEAGRAEQIAALADALKEIEPQA